VLARVEDTEGLPVAGELVELREVQLIPGFPQGPVERTLGTTSESGCILIIGGPLRTYVGQGLPPCDSYILVLPNRTESIFPVYLRCFDYRELGIFKYTFTVPGELGWFWRVSGIQLTV